MANTDARPALDCFRAFYASDTQGAGTMTWWKWKVTHLRAWDTFSGNPTQTITYTDTDTTTISVTNEASVSFKAETNFFVTKDELTVGYKLGVNYTTQSTETKQTSTAFTFSASVPGNSTIVASCVASQDKFSVPWTATALVYYQNQSQPERITNLKGILNGVQVTNLTAVYNP